MLAFIIHEVANHNPGLHQKPKQTVCASKPLSRMDIALMSLAEGEAFAREKERQAQKEIIECEQVQRLVLSGRESAGEGLGDLAARKLARSEEARKLADQMEASRLAALGEKHGQLERSLRSDLEKERVGVQRLRQDFAAALEKSKSEAVELQSRLSREQSARAQAQSKQVEALAELARSRAGLGIAKVSEEEEAQLGRWLATGGACALLLAALGCVAGRGQSAKSASSNAP